MKNNKIFRLCNEYTLVKICY